MRFGWLMVCFMGGVGVGLGALVWKAGSIYQGPWRDLPRPLPKVDGIICLTGGRGRLAAAEHLWQEYAQSFSKGPVFYLSGVDPLVAKAAWVQQLKKRLEGVAGASSVSLVLEQESRNTFENALEFSAFLASQKNPWKAAVLVTSAYHQKRARRLFLKALEAALPPDQGASFQLYDWPVFIPPFGEGQWYMNWNSFKLTVGEYLKGEFLEGVLLAH